MSALNEILLSIKRYALLGLGKNFKKLKWDLFVFIFAFLIFKYRGSVQGPFNEAFIGKCSVQKLFVVNCIVRPANLCEF